MRLIVAPGLVGLATLLLLSCQSGQPTTPAASEGATAPLASALIARADGADLLAGFRIELDPETLTATVTPHRTASAQPPQGQRYDLDIANFQNADSFRVTGVQVLGSGNFRISFSHAHPFPAPNIANPATGLNRADLGYTGRLVILTTYNPKSFFAGDVRLSAGAVVAPDGYVETGNLLANAVPGLVTAYPYKLLADEAQNNRTGVSNEGNPEGSFVEAAGGWQRINMGASGTGWTGFDYLHAGQTVTNQFVLSQESLAASNFALDVALLIQYQDPRGAGGSTFRFPSTVIDPLQFAYRLPYAALDCSRVIPSASVTLAPVVGNSTTLEVRVRDWDASAAEAGDSKVGDETDVALVQAGGSGAPEVVLDAPGILSGLRNMGTPGSESGWSDDPLLYSNSLPNQEGAAAGTYYGCLRITDPEFDDAARNTYHAGVDATTLLPDAARAVPARTWQIVPIMVGPEPPIITAVTPTGIVGGVDERITFSATATNNPTSWFWFFGPGANPGNSNEATPTVQLSSAIGTYTGNVIATNAGGDSQVFEFTYRVLEPQRPGWSMYNLDEITGSGADSGTIRNLILYNGKPVLLMHPDFTEGPMRLGIAEVPVPESPSDWNFHDIVPQYARYGSPFILNGKLAITYVHDEAVFDDLRLALTDSTTPSQTSDWRSFVARTDAGSEVRPMAVEYDGRVAIAYENFDTDQIATVISSTLSPESPDDFAWCEVYVGGSFPAIAVVSGETDPRIMVAFCVESSKQLAVFQSEPELPSSSGNWLICGSYSYTYPPRGVTMTTYTREPSQVGAIIAWSNPDTLTPMVAYSSGVSFVGKQGLSASYALPGSSTGGDISITTLNSRLAIVTSSGSFLSMSRAMQPGIGSFDWAGLGFPQELSIATDVAVVSADNRYVVGFANNDGTGRHYTIAVSSGPF